MRRPPSYTETYLALATPVATLLVLPVVAALAMTFAMVIWVVLRWGSL